MKRLGSGSCWRSAVGERCWFCRRRCWAPGRGAAVPTARRRAWRCSTAAPSGTSGSTNPVLWVWNAETGPEEPPARSALFIWARLAAWVSVAGGAARCFQWRGDQGSEAGKGASKRGGSQELCADELAVPEGRWERKDGRKIAKLPNYEVFITFGLLFFLLSYLIHFYSS